MCVAGCGLLTGEPLPETFALFGWVMSWRSFYGVVALSGAESGGAHAARDARESPFSPQRSVRARLTAH